MKRAIPITVPVPDGGCRYREHSNLPACRKICDPGKNMCPHHLLISEYNRTQAEAKNKRAG